MAGRRARRVPIHRLPVLLLLLAAVSCATATRPAPTADLAVTRVNVVDVERGRILADRTVLVRGNRIAVLAPASDVTVPAGARVIDGHGKYLIPGLWDMHAHVVAEENWRWRFPLYLASGVTGVRNMGVTGEDSALALALALRKRIATGEVIGPRLVTTGPLLDGAPGVWPKSLLVTNAAEGRHAVDSLADAGVDFVKVYQQLPRDGYFAIAAEARRRGVPFVGHVPMRISAEEAIGAGQRSVEHLLWVAYACTSGGDSLRASVVASKRRPSAASWAHHDAARCRAIMTAMRERGTWMVPTFVEAHVDPQRELARIDSMFADSALWRRMPAAVAAEWRASYPRDRALLLDPDYLAFAAAVRASLEDVRVVRPRILAGTDVGVPFVEPGASLHQELQLLVRHLGLTPLEALQTATIEPARFLGMTDSLGTVQPGKLADLVLLDADPLADIRNTTRIAGVVANGRYHEPSPP